MAFGYPYFPDWLDPATAEWCAELCDNMAARIAAVDRSPNATGTAYLGAELCAISIRENMKVARERRAPLRLLPAPVDEEPTGRYWLWRTQNDRGAL